MTRTLLRISLFTFILSACTQEPETVEWRYYHGGLDNNQYSTVDQINTDNVGELREAWRYKVKDGDNTRAIKSNSLMIDGVLYGTTAQRNLVALDARTGEEKWLFDFSKVDEKGRTSSARGLHFWQKGDQKRILHVYAEHLYAINPDNGQLYEDFGENGRIHFSTGLLGSENKRVSLTSPGVIFKDLLIVGSSVSEHLPAAPGDIRAFNVITGELVWSFHTIPHPGEPGYETWPPNAYQALGGANCWGGISLDNEREIAFVPTGSPTYDFYGANRAGQNLYANCLLALNANTGERIWHFQMVHHDLWDRDLPCPPNLIQVKRDGKTIDAVAQATKEGYVYVFDRDTGEPLFDIEEVPVPKSPLSGEETWPTQPIPVKPPPFTRQVFTKDLITNISPESHAYVEKEYEKYQTEKFAPPTPDGILIQPFFNGGANWGGAAFDPKNELFVINANDFPWLLKLIDLKETLTGVKLDGATLYQSFCASCHGDEMQGGHYVPPLTDIAKKASFVQTIELIESGVGLMPPFDYLSEDQKSAIAAYILGMENPDKNLVEASDIESALSEDLYKLRYTNKGYQRFLDQDGYPAIQPPWGTLTAYDLNKGEIVWQEVLGEYEELTKKGIPPTGAKNQGGPLATAGNLIFIGSTEDQKFRAFDVRDGQKIWEYDLPGNGYATPMTYMLDGKQYVVIPASGSDEEGVAGYFIAFSLPSN